MGACGRAVPPPLPTPVTKAGFERSGKTWPFSVSGGTVGCSHGNEWWFQANGVRYGLNDYASPAKGYAPLDRIWALEASPVVTPPPADLPRELKQTPQGPQTNGAAALLELAQVLC